MIYSETNLRTMMGYAALAVVPIVVILVLAARSTGLHDAAVMDQAQLARHLAGGDGFVTSVVRPPALSEHPQYRGHPDLVNAPAWPCYLAAWYTVAGASDRVTVWAGGLLWMVSVWLVYLLASRRFGVVEGGLAALFYLGGRAVLEATAGGAGTALMGFWPLLAAWLVVPPAAADAPAASGPRQLAAWRLVLVGLVCAAAVLTDYLLLGLWVGLLFYLVGDQKRIHRALGLCLAGFLVGVAPWVIRHAQLGETWLWGRYGYNLLAGMGSYPADLVWREPAPPEILTFALGEPLQMLRKVIHNSYRVARFSVGAIHPLLGLLLLAALLDRRRRPGLGRLAAVTLVGFAGTAVTACLFAPAETVLAAWTPLCAVVAAVQLKDWIERRARRVSLAPLGRAWARLLGIEDRPTDLLPFATKNLPAAVNRVLLGAAVSLLVLLPLFYLLVVERAPRPPTDKGLALSLRESLPVPATVLTDEPFLLAWYAAREALLPCVTEAEFVAIERRAGPVEAAYFSPTAITRSAPASQEWLSWLVSPSGIYRGMATVTPHPGAGVLRRQVPELPGSERLDRLAARVTAQPNSEDDRLALGMEYLRLDRLREADEQFRAVLDLNDNNLDALTGRWRIQAQLRDVLNLLPIIRRAVDLNPADPRHAAILRESLRAVRQALLVYPQDPWVILLAAMYQAKRGDWDEARTLMRYVVDATGTSIPPEILLALLYLQHGLPADARALLVKLEQRQELQAPALYLLGRAAEAEGDLDGALDAYRKALRLRPSWAAVETAVATIHLRRGEHQVAVEHFRNLLARDPQALRLHLGLAAALEGMGDTAAATAVYKRVREMYPNLPADLKVLPPSVAAD